MTRYWNDSLYLQEDELAHYGVLGMHWGVRRYQNKDGSYTKAGLKKKAKRDAQLKEYEDNLKKSTDEYNNYSKAVTDLRKSGRKSRTYKGLVASGDEEFRYLPLMDVIDGVKVERDASKAQMRTAQKLIDNIKNTKITDLTADEKSAPYQKLTLGTMATSTVLGTVADVKLGTYGLGFAGMGLSAFGLNAAGVLDKANPTYWVNNQQKK